MSSRKWSAEPTKANPIGADRVLILDSEDSDLNKLITLETIPPWIRTSTTISPEIITDSLAIGVITANNQLDVHSATAEAAIAITSLGANTNALLKFELADNTPTFTIGVDDSDGDKFKIGTNTLGTDTRLTIDSAGFIGIGQTAPTNLLHVESVTATNLALFNTTGGSAARIQIRSTNNSGIEFLEGAIPQWTILSFNNNFEIASSGVADGIILRKSDGFMGLNIPNVATLHNNLDILSTTTSTFIGITSTFATGDVGIKFELTDNTPLFTMGIDNSDADKFKIGTTALETNTRITLDSTGKVGIGVDDPTELLEVFGNIKVRQFGNFILDLGAQDNANAGGRAVFRGGGNSGSPFDDWTIDIFFEQMRLFTTSTTPETFKIFNGGTSFIDVIIDGRLHIGDETAPPLHTLDVHGTTGLHLTESATNVDSGVETIIGITNTAAPRTVNLRTVDAVPSRTYWIKDQSAGAGTNNITIQTEGSQTIDGADTLVLAVDRAGVILYCDNTNNWQIIART